MENKKEKKKKIGMYVIENGKTYVFILKKTRKVRMCIKCERIIEKSEEYYYLFRGGDLSGCSVSMCKGCVKESFGEGK